MERPASVVKELLENSLDAGATHLIIELRSGGTELIRVADNGCGIPANETSLLFQRHATSKLWTAEELHSISSLGFRGEALYAIAAVSSVSLLTRVASEASGIKLEIQLGEPPSRAPHGAPVGTSVTVENLFRKVPARLKFLRSARAEATRVQSVVTAYAQAYPEVHFSLEIDGRTVFTTPGMGNLREVAAAVYGVETARTLLEIANPENASVRVKGVISSPETTRANRGYITLFVNRRAVQNRSLAYAVVEAYRGFLPQGRYPIAVLDITVPLEDVDVNVHPAKSEVRFRHENEVFVNVQRAVREALVTLSPIPALDPRSLEFSTGSLSGSSTGSGSQPTKETTPPAGGMVTKTLGALKITSTEVQTAGADTSLPPPLWDALSNLRVFGQVRGTYIMAEGPQGIFLIDQHAAHERVVFERIRQAADRRTPEVQGLLEAVTVELSPKQANLMEDQKEALTSYGWTLEPFGEYVCLIRAIPAALSGHQPARALLDLLDATLEERTAESWENRLAATLACHAAVRGGMELKLSEMEEMIRLLEATKEPHTCPHGRPTILHLSIGHLERQFRRS